MPVLHPNNPGTILLRTGAELTRQTISRLREIRCREVWVRCPGLEHIRDYISPAVHAAHGVVAGKVSKAFQSTLRDADPELQFGVYRSAISALIERLLEDPRSNLYIQEMIETDVRGLQHAANVCMLSVLIGLKLDFYLERERSRLSPAHARDVCPLGMGALLHDIGMLRIPEEAVEHWLHTGDESDPQLREHVRIGYRMVRGEIEPAASAVVLHHHQRFDGSGFPALPERMGGEQALAGHDIHVFARIVAVADVFNRLRHPLGDATARPTPIIRVLGSMMRGPLAPRLDPVVVKGLLTVVPPFPPGTVVRLSDGRWAVVTQWTPSAPCQPVVEALPNGFRAATEVDPDLREPIDLSADPGLTIEVAEGVDVSQDVFGPAEVRGLDLARLAASMSSTPR